MKLTKAMKDEVVIRQLLKEDAERKPTTWDRFEVRPVGKDSYVIYDNLTDRTSSWYSSIEQAQAAYLKLRNARLSLQASEEKSIRTYETYRQADMKRESDNLWFLTEQVEVFGVPRIDEGEDNG